MPISFESEALVTSFFDPESPGVRRTMWAGTTGTYSVVLKDQTGTRIPDTAFSAITLTLVDEESATVLNTRSAQDVLNLNDCTINAVGEFVWHIQTADTPTVDATKRVEYHRAIFRFVFDTGDGEEVVQRIVRIPITTNFTVQNGPVGDPGTNGVVVRIGVDSYTARVITGTTGHILVTNGSGVSGNPTIDLDLPGGANLFLNADGDYAPIAGAGLGDVTGPMVAVNNNIAVFDGTTGKVIKDSGVSVNDIGGAMMYTHAFLLMGG